jgi:phage N-6-adenine-methyltransferase
MRRHHRATLKPPDFDKTTPQKCVRFFIIPRDFMSGIGTLGNELKLARTAAGLSQVALAERAGVSLSTIRQAESGEGRLDSYMKAAAVLGLSIGSRIPLPAANTVGQQLGVYRLRLGKSQRGVAKAAGISAPTAAAIEAGKDVLLNPVEAVASVLGVPLCLEKDGRPKSFVTAATSSVHQCWTTPDWIMERLYSVVGGHFDLDPCSPCKSQEHAPVRARRYYTEADDGLSRPWKGRVYMNPPYGRSISNWVSKAAEEALSGRARPVIALIPARVDTEWWHTSVVAAGACVTMLKGRIAFGGIGGTTAPFPSALIMWSWDQEHVERMRAAFPDAWHVAGAFAGTTLTEGATDQVANVRAGP